MRASVLAAASLVLAPATVANSAQPKLAYEIGVVSDYRDRGLTVSDNKPALQAGVHASLPSGAYVGLWGSTIDEYAGEGDEHGATVELDVTLGWAFQAAGFDVDVGLTAYTYPRAQNLTYVEAPLSISRSLGSATLTLGAAYAPRQAALDADNTYVFGSVGWEIEATELSASLGYEDGVFAESGKWDWSVTAVRRFRGMRAQLSYIGADDNVTSSALVAGVAVEF